MIEPCEEYPEGKVTNVLASMMLEAHLEFDGPTRHFKVQREQDAQDHNRKLMSEFDAVMETLRNA